MLLLTKLNCVPEMKIVIECHAMAFTCILKFNRKANNEYFIVYFYFTPLILSIS